MSATRKKPAADRRPVRERLLEYNAQHPGATAAAIARAIGATRQRVQELAKAEGLELPRYTSTFAPPVAPPPDLGSRLAPPALTGHATVAGDDRAIAVLRVAADLAARGYEVFAAVGPSSADLVACDAGTGSCERIRISLEPVKARGEHLYGRLGEPWIRAAVAKPEQPIEYQPAFVA